MLTGIFVSGVLLVIAGSSRGHYSMRSVVETLLDPSFRSVLFQAGPLIFVGLGAAVAFRVRFWNFGIEGQMIWGAIRRHVGQHICDRP